MAINNTGAMFKSFEFDGTDSRNFGVYITGAAVYNAPEREVEMISIPNRNGAFALDKGRFENIEITYPAGIYADTEADFAEAISDLRNFLCSKRGYCRLTDEYNPNEYRMAIYKSGLEVEPALLKAGEFEITFECMPQRFLTSGETKTTLTSPATVTNPTLFASKPMLEVAGYGEIGINADRIELEDRVIGRIVVAPQTDLRSWHSYNIPIDDTYASAGDSIYFQPSGLIFNIQVGLNGKGLSNPNLSVTGTGTNPSGSYTKTTFKASVTVDLDSDNELQFAYGTPKTITTNITFSCTIATIGAYTYTALITIDYDGTNNFQYTISSTETPLNTYAAYNLDFMFGPVLVDSTVSVLGNPVYIDLDIGEAYKIESGSIVSVNDAVNMPANLPVLNPGSNTITYDNTFTDVKIVPRWWKI